MDVTIGESTVAGTCRAPPSKSYTHRAILAAGYADGALVNDALVSADTEATMRAVDAFGGDVEREGETLDVSGFGGDPEVPADVLDCANSGTTIRLTTGTAALADGLTVLTGDGSLRSRPQGPLLDALVELGARAESTRRNGQAPLVVGGPVDGGTVSMPGHVSSQYVTSLLMAGANTTDGVEITLETELKSAPYVEITREVLAAFGVETEWEDRSLAVPGDQFYEPSDGEYTVPGDFSSASYLLAAGALAAPDGVDVRGLFPSAQGDAAIVDVLDEMDAEVSWNRDDGVVTVSRSTLSGATVDVGDTPDLLPTIAVLGAVGDGTTVIENCAHVRLKETDRVEAMATELSKMGAVVQEDEDRLVVKGDETDLVGARVDGRADHRVIMSLAIAGLVADGETTVTGAEHVDVSFPRFFETLYGMGASVRHATGGGLIHPERETE